MTVTEASVERRAGGMASFAAGAFFAALYVAFLYYLPTGHFAEFAYFPPARFPFDAMMGFTVEQLALHVAGMALLGPALLLIGFGLSRWWPDRALERISRRQWLLVACGLSLLLSTIVLTKVLRGYAIVDDEVTFTYQAALLATGRIADNTLPDWGYEAFTIATPLGFTGKYLFGEPLVQIPGVWFGLPGIAHLALAGLLFVLWYRIVRGEAGPEVAAWAAAILALSPMLILATGTGLSHTTSLFCIVAAGYGIHLIRILRPLSGALVAGGAIGFGLAVRMQVMLPMGAVLGLIAAAELIRRRAWGPLLGLAGSGGAWVLLIAAYNRALTGSYLRLPWYLFEPLERYGFGTVSNEGGSLEHTPWMALRNLAVSALRWNGWWMGLPLGLLVLVVWAALGRPRAGLRVWFWAGAALVAFNFLYYSPGVSDLGPVYYFELLLPGSLLAAHTVVAARRRWGTVATAVIGVHLLLGTGGFLAEQLARLSRLAQAMHAPVREALQKVEIPGLVFYETAIQESLHPGWMFSFPVRYRSDHDPIVTFPRHQASIVQALRARFSDRHCYYYRVEPQTLTPQLLECAQAEELLARPYELPGPALLPRSTAYKLGFGRPEWTPSGAAAPPPAR